MSSINFERRRGRQSFASISKLIGYLFWTKQEGNHLEMYVLNKGRHVMWWSVNKNSLHSRGSCCHLKTRSKACKSGFCERKEIWILRNEPIARNSIDCVLFKIRSVKLLLDQNIAHRLQTATHAFFVAQSRTGWHILSNILILCQNSLAKPHWKFVSEPRKKFYGNQNQFAFYPNCTDLVQFLLPWTFCATT